MELRFWEDCPPNTTEGSDDSYSQPNKYYIWIPLLLVFHGVSFYLPHLLFKTWAENKDVKLVTEKF